MTISFLSGDGDLLDQMIKWLEFAPVIVKDVQHYEDTDGELCLSVEYERQTSG